jgi:putative ABC transport system substrate-binding protein
MKAAFFALILLALLLAACSSSDEPEEPEQHFTVGLVIPHEVTLPIFDNYRLAMAALGYIEGENITYIWKGPPENFIDLLQMPAQLVDEDVDLMVVLATEGALLAQGATQDIPIVFIAGDAPVEAGLAESLDRPGGNITGVMATGPEARRMELFLEIAPDMQTLYVPHSVGDMMADNSFAEIEDAAEAFDITLITDEIETEEELQVAIQNIPQEADGIFLPQDMLVTTETGAWANEAIAHQLPLSAPGVGSSETTGVYPTSPLMGYGLSVEDLAERAARLTDQVLRGSNPGDLPIESADFYLMVNVDTADAIGVEIPDHILEQAHYIAGYADNSEE